MASIIIRDIDDQLEARLRVQVARHGRSMEDARDILRVALTSKTVRAVPLVDSIRARIEEAAGGLELEAAAREAICVRSTSTGEGSFARGPMQRSWLG